MMTLRNVLSVLFLMHLCVMKYNEVNGYINTTFMMPMSIFCNILQYSAIVAYPPLK